jgi:hypothetical protein
MSSRTHHGLPVRRFIKNALLFSKPKGRSLPVPGLERGHDEDSIQRQTGGFLSFRHYSTATANTGNSLGEYIAAKFRARGILCPPEPINEAISKSGGHPQDTMVVCSELYYALLEAGQDIISLELVQLGYERALLTLAPIYDEILDDLNLSFVGRQVLKRIATAASIYSMPKPTP